MNDSNKTENAPVPDLLAALQRSLDAAKAEHAPSQIPPYDAIWAEVNDPEDNRFRSGWAVLIAGAAVPRESVEAAITDYHGEGWERVLSEVWHLDYQKRVKFCSRHGSGFGCDMEGEWHSHWHAIKHNDAAADCCYTLGLPVWPERRANPLNSEE